MAIPVVHPSLCAILARQASFARRINFLRRFLVVASSLPSDDPMRKMLLGTLRTWRVVLPECQDDGERRALMEQAQKLVEEYENRLREEAHLLSLNEGERQGLDKGKKLGLDEGKVEQVLRRRGLPLSEAQAAQLAACHDLETLERWLDLAITASTSTDVFG
jgi:hypothetical protein